MTSHLAATFIAGVALGSGCAFHKEAVVLDPIGPPSLSPSISGVNGKLVVYTAFDPNADFNDVLYLRRYTDYRILSEAGKCLQVVQNNVDNFMETPRELELPVGSYRVIARANKYKEVSVPVAIVANQVTTVHLDGSAAWPENAALLRSNPVRLPDGEIAGWRANNKEVAAKP